MTFDEEFKIEKKMSAAVDELRREFSREKALECMKLIQTVNEFNEETSHRDADAVVSEILKSVGYEDVAEIYDNLHCWFS